MQILPQWIWVVLAAQAISVGIILQRHHTRERRILITAGPVRVISAEQNQPGPGFDVRRELREILGPKYGRIEIAKNIAIVFPGLNFSAMFTVRRS